MSREDQRIDPHEPVPTVPQDGWSAIAQAIRLRIGELAQCDMLKTEVLPAFLLVCNQAMLFEKLANAFDADVASFKAAKYASAEGEA